MSSFHKIIVLIATIALQSCKDRNPPITKTLILSQEMMNYFVDYSVGTKWIYQDTTDKTNYDTIELVSKENVDVNNGNGTLTKGYSLYYTPKKSKDFKVFIDPGLNNSYFIKVDPLVAAAGKISFEYSNGAWVNSVQYYDSLKIAGSLYHKVVKSLSSSDYHAGMAIGENMGIIFFSRMNGGGIIADYKLIGTIKP